MNIEIRLYKTYDADLIALAMSGYSVATMMKEAVCCYANSLPVEYVIDRPQNVDFNEMKTIHTRFSIPKSDTKSILLMKNIKHRCRNMFCKAILRNALVQQNLAVFIASGAPDEIVALYNINSGQKGTAKRISVSTVPIHVEQLSVFSDPQGVGSVKSIPSVTDKANEFKEKLRKKKNVEISVSEKEEDKDISDGFMEDPDFGVDDDVEEIFGTLPAAESEDESEPTSSVTFDALDKLMGNDFE